MKTFRAWIAGLGVIAVAAPSFVFTSEPANAGGATYYFSTHGSDANDGRTPEHPLLSLDRIPALLEPGTSVLLKRGDVWYVPGLTLDLRRGDVRIGAYGDPSLPRPSLVALARFERSKWQGDPNGTMNVSVPAATRRARVFAAGVRLLSDGGDGYLRDRTFRVVQGRIEFVLSDPRITELEVDPGDTPPLVHLNVTGDLTIEDVDFRGAEGWKAVRVEGASHKVALNGVTMSNYPGPVLNGEPLFGPPDPGTYYVDPEGGSTGGDGTIESPWKSVGKITNWLAPGVTVLIKRGTTWRGSILNWGYWGLNGTAEDSVVIGAYGSGARPVIAGMVFDSTGTDPGNEWQSTAVSTRFRRRQLIHSATDDRVYRLFVNHVPLPKVHSLGSLTTNTFCVDSGWVYVQTASTSAPVTESIQEGRGGGRDTLYPFASFKDVHYLTIRDLDFRGGGIGFAAPNSHVTLSNLAVSQCLRGGIGFAQWPVDTVITPSSNLTVQNCVLDRTWTADLNTAEPDTVYGVTVFPDASSDGIGLVDAVDAATITGNWVTNFAHSGIGAAVNSTPGFGTKNVLIENNILTAGSSGYCRGLGFGGDDRCTGMVARRNYVHDANIQSQFGGQSNFVYSNIFNTTNLSSLASFTTAQIAMTSGGGAGSGTLGAGYAKSCVFANNTLYAAPRLFQISGWSNNDATHHYGSSNKFMNNLLVDWAPMQSDPYFNVNPVSAMFTITTWDTVCTYRMNAFWDSHGRDKVFAIGQAWNDVDSFTVSGFNALSYADSNELANPQFVASTFSAPDSFALGVGSPFRGGGVPLSQLLPDSIAAVDYFGNTFHATTPSRGAIQYQYTALSSASISGTPGGPILPSTAVNASSSLSPSNAEVQTYAWTVKKSGVTQTTGSGSTISYTPTTTGSYTIDLAVTDYVGHTRNATQAAFDVWNAPVIVASYMVGGHPALLDDGDSTNQNVTVTATNYTSLTATRNGSAYSWPSGGVFTASGTYVITAVGASTTNFTFTKL